jgi:hypothetical protein
MALMLLKEHMGRDPKRVTEARANRASRILSRNADGSITIVNSGGKQLIQGGRNKKKGFINSADFASYTSNK